MKHSLPLSLFLSFAFVVVLAPARSSGKGGEQTDTAIHMKSVVTFNDTPSTVVQMP